MKNFMTIGEGANFLRIHPDTLRRWTKEGRLKGYKVGKRWLYTEEDLSTLFVLPAGNAREVVGKGNQKIVELVEKVQAEDAKRAEEFAARRSL